MTPSELQAELNELIEEMSKRDIALPAVKLALLVIKHRKMIEQGLTLLQQFNNMRERT